MIAFNPSVQKWCALFVGACFRGIKGVAWRVASFRVMGEWVWSRRPYRSSASQRSASKTSQKF
ncbi:hypothetical protein CY96_20000 [Bacillus bombysepticus str. Wang]|uniref:Uncharacterized protein n=1 Tax=Bacillus bombysepticus str. Wang TaxID=1330043 RepID=A0A9W3L4V9_9BACI|nr:hypothetical protein CY96_20000 [Bacillus bombysepticus str. Wang]